MTPNASRPATRLLLLASLALLPLSPAHAADKSTAQSITLPTGPLAFTATVETIRLANPRGTPIAEIVATAFTVDAPDRPVTFALNGGPGSASAWLDVGALGPWRVRLGTPSASPALLDNPDSWLPATDLVFLDPVGTGYSRALPTSPTDDNPQRPFLAVEPDIDALATAIRRWLEAHGRLAADKFIVGESYGGFRAPRLARTLLERQGVGIRGLILVSPVLDFNGRDAPYDPVRHAARLPSIVAASKNARARSDLADAEAYARGEYLTDLLRGPNDAPAQERIASRLAALTGLDPASIRRRAGRLDLELVLRGRHQDTAPPIVASPYDATLAAADPFPAAVHDNSPDPLLDGLRAPVTSGILQLYQRLQWQPEGAPAREYQLLNTGIAGAWDYGRSNTRPESMTALRQFLALDPAARVLVVHGLTDLVTPYFATALLLDQVPETTPPGRLQLRTLPGGHMMYTRDSSRAALAAQAAAFLHTPAASQE